MNTEQLKTDRQAIEILREEYKAKLTGDQMVSLHREIDEFCDDEELEPRNAILSAMDIFASQESKRAVDEFKDKLRRGLFRLDMYGPDNMVKMKEFEDLIDKL